MQRSATKGGDGILVHVVEFSHVQPEGKTVISLLLRRALLFSMRRGVIWADSGFDDDGKGERRLVWLPPYIWRQGGIQPSFGGLFLYLWIERFHANRESVLLAGWG